MPELEFPAGRIVEVSEGHTGDCRAPEIAKEPREEYSSGVG
jgi:hypothetical protein